MDEIKKLLENMQQEIRQQKTDMVEMKEDIKNTINNNINEKFKNLELKNELLEKKIEEQNIAINNFERYIRRKNLIIFGVEEQEKSYYDLEKIIIEIIHTYFGFQYENNCIEAVRRLGKKSEKVRPIVITFTTMGLKLKIQRDGKCLEKTPYYLKQDYPLEVLNKRKELQPQLKREKELGKKAFIKYDKLIVLDNKETNTPQTYTNKRNLSESPEMITDSGKEVQQNKKQPKRNKIANMNMKNFIIQKPKLAYHPEENTQKQSTNNQENKE